MIITVYTIEETIFEAGIETDYNLLRFRDKDTRNKYLKNITLKKYLSEIESGILTPHTYDLNPKSKIKFKVEFDHVELNKVISIKAGIDHIEIIESVYQNENQLQLDL